MDNRHIKPHFNSVWLVFCLLQGSILFLAFLSTISLPPRCVVPPLPYSHLPNIWETLESERMLQRASSWQRLDASACGAVALPLAPDSRGQLTPARQEHTHSLIEPLRWNDEPQLIFPALNHLSSSFTFISSFHMWARSQHTHIDRQLIQIQSQKRWKHTYIVKGQEHESHTVGLPSFILTCICWKKLQS